MASYSFITGSTKYAVPVPLLSDTQNLPDGYKRLKYIEIPESPLYLTDANLSVSSTFGMEVEFQLQNVSSQTADNIGIIGCKGLDIYLDTTGIAARCSLGTTADFTYNWDLDESKHTVTLNANLLENYSFYFDGDYKGQSQAETFSTTKSLFIGNSNTDENFANMIGRIYSVKYYDSEDVVNTFYPAIRMSDKVSGLYKFTGDTATAFITSSTAKSIQPKEIFKLYVTN